MSVVFLSPLPLFLVGAPPMHFYAALILYHVSTQSKQEGNNKINQALEQFQQLQTQPLSAVPKGCIYSADLTNQNFLPEKSGRAVL